MALEDILHPFLKAYIGAPQWVKSSIGSTYSALPNSVKYGREFARFREEAALRDSSLELAEMVNIKLSATLENALRAVPAFRQFEDLLQGGAKPLDILAALPLSGKEEIKANLAGYLSTAYGERDRLRMFTGGSTANPMMFYAHKHLTRPKESAYYAEFDRRAGIGPRDVILNLRGRSVPTANDPSGRIWMYEPIKRHLILSSDHLEPRFMPEYVKVLKEWKPQFIQAFPSALFPLAKWLDFSPEPEITDRIRCIQLTSENVYPYQLDLLRRVFKCPVLSGYGHTERVLLATTMPDDDRYFFEPLYGHLELVDGAGQVITQPGVLGEIVGTSFDNFVMPFIRFRTGDFGAWSDRPHSDLPGFPVLERIEGRLQEFVVCQDQRLISICTLGAAHFSQLAAVESIQYEQKEAGKLVLKIVSPAELASATKQAIQAAVVEKTQGGCVVEVVRVDAIPRTARGKHKMLVQHIDISGYFGSGEQGSAGHA